MTASFIAEISQFLGESPKPYHIPNSPDHSCVYWDLPAVKEESRPIHLRYNDLAMEIAGLCQQNPDDPRILILKKDADRLIEGIPVTKKFGIFWVGINDLLKLDQTRGLRKEWLELAERSTGTGASLFQGYKTPEAQMSRIADMLVLMPNPDPFEFIRLNQTHGSNHAVTPEQIIKTLQKLDSDFCITLTFAASDLVEFIFNNPLASKDQGRIRQRLVRLCPEAEELTAGIRSGRVELWWD